MTALAILALSVLFSWPAPAEVWDSVPAAYGTQEDAFSGPLIAVDGTGDPSLTQGCSQSKLWAIDSCGDRSTEAHLTQGSAGAAKLTAGTKGYATLMYRLPSGDLKSHYLGYVYPGQSYALRFCAESPGTYEAWYKVGFQESNRVRFHIFG